MAYAFLWLKIADVFADVIGGPFSGLGGKMAGASGRMAPAIKASALVAQLDRVLVSEAKGRGFDSRRARHNFSGAS